MVESHTDPRPDNLVHEVDGMTGEPRIVTDGTVTTPKGFVAGSAYAGIKTYAKDKWDLGILVSERACVTVGVYTQNKFVSPSVTLTRQNIDAGRVRALVVSSGIANTGVGAQGMVDAKETVALAAAQAGLEPGEMIIGTTGVIGVELPMALIRSGIPSIETGRDGGEQFARAILTTDRVPKSAAVQLELGGKRVTIGGCAKGSGMIHPNMATMLAYLTTDANVGKEVLAAALTEVVADTFNMVDIDGDVSTNDMVVLFANGAAGNKPVVAGSPEARAFVEALAVLSRYLSAELVRDAEGSTKIFTVHVEGAASREDARLAARAVASSTLVKAAIHGSDPNWGRAICAVGYSGADVDVDKVSFFINDVAIMEAGTPISFHREAVIAIMNNPEVSLTVKLGIGDGSATAWGCELTEGYVQFNSAYTT